MAERDGKLSLEQFLARRWHFEDYLRSQGMSEQNVAQEAAESFAVVAEEHPDWSKDRVRTALALSYLTMDLKEVAIARRFTLADPTELGRGLSVLSRLRWLENLIGGHTHVDFQVLVDAFAVRDLAVAQYLTQGEPAISQGPPEFLDLCTVAVAAVYRKDFAEVQSVLRKMAKQKLRPWQQGIQQYLTGVADHQPKQVADGLALLLDGMRKMRQKDEFEEAINLPAQGLYRLAEWIGPDLVAEFDVNQPFPWDAEFHAWCQSHPEPLAGVDLTGIELALHQAVVHLQPPAEWVLTASR
ncbi:MAG TPA: hypothetical protein VHR66_14975 [Gemmataceae bacterium]|nr:hypothetical protein [Gemmataceae bacterium]